VEVIVGLQYHVKEGTLLWDCFIIEVNVW